MFGYYLVAQVSEGQTRLVWRDPPWLAVVKRWWWQRGFYREYWRFPLDGQDDLVDSIPSKALDKARRHPYTRKTNQTLETL